MSGEYNTIMSFPGLKGKLQIESKKNPKSSAVTYPSMEHNPIDRSEITEQSIVPLNISSSRAKSITDGILSKDRAPEKTALSDSSEYGKRNTYIIKEGAMNGASIVPQADSGALFMELPQSRENSFSSELKLEKSEKADVVLNNVYSYVSRTLGSVKHAAYFGSSSDAKWLLSSTNTKHGWLYDKIPFSGDPYRCDSGSVEEFREHQIKDIAELNRKIENNLILPYDHGFFQCEMSAYKMLGELIAGNLIHIGATDINVRRVDDFRVDYAFNWRHPSESETKPRKLSLMWLPADDGPWKQLFNSEDSENRLRKQSPKFDFIMTRGLNSQEEIPELNTLIEKERSGGLLFLDNERVPESLVEKKEVPGMLSGRDIWSMHGELNIFKRN